MHDLASFVICNNLSYNYRVSRIIVPLYLRGLLFEKDSERAARKWTQYD